MNLTAEFRKRFVEEAAATGLTEAEVQEAIGSLARTPAIEAAEAHTGAGCLLLLGNAGVGKTLAAARWLISPLLNLSAWIPNPRFTTGFRTPGGESWVTRSRSLRWVSARSLARVKQYDQDSVAELLTPARLVIDDLGVEYLDKGGFLLSLVDEIISERHRHQRPSVLTANLGPKEFSDRYGMRVLDRIRGSGKAVVCDGKSLRGAKIKAQIPEAFTDDAIASRLADYETRAQADRVEQQRRWDEEDRKTTEAATKATEARAALRTDAAGAKAPSASAMTDDELAARKAQIAADLARWRAEQGEA